ncbi:MAG: sensor histidine kinase, partial [Hyphomicrobium sp.]
MPPIAGWWRGLDIATQFVVAATTIIGFGLSALAWWAGERIERGVVEHAVASAALHLDAFVEPHVQDLTRGGVLSDASQASLTRLTEVAHHPTAVSGIRIWSPGGKLVFSTYAGDTGAADSAPAASIGMGAGHIADHFAYSGDPALGVSRPLLKIFAPMHISGTRSVIAVAELHEFGDALAARVGATRWQTALIFTMISVSMIGALSSIVRSGSRTIAEQRQRLGERVLELSSLLDSHGQLQQRLVGANRSAADTNERHLRRIGADLHDGPVQLIALSLLRLESLQEPAQNAGEMYATDYKAVESALRDALSEIRELSSGLCLPEFKGLGVAKVIEFAVVNHERRSRTRVAVESSDDLPAVGSNLMLASVYRFVQEGLNNAVRHAGGKGQTVLARRENDMLILEVADQGPGMAEPAAPSSGQRLGLIGLRERIEALGGC